MPVLQQTPSESKLVRSARAYAFKNAESAPLDMVAPLSVVGKSSLGLPRAMKFFKEKAGKYVRRVEEESAELSMKKPHGLYTSPAEHVSPHADLGGKEFVLKKNPEAKVLDLSTELKIPVREGAEDSGAGVHALAELVGKDEFDVLLSMKKTELEKLAKMKYPDVDFSRYFDKQEILEALGGLEAKSNGYDALNLASRADEAFSEYVGLTEKAFEGKVHGGK